MVRNIVDSPCYVLRYSKKTRRIRVRQVYEVWAASEAVTVLRLRVCYETHQGERFTTLGVSSAQGVCAATMCCPFALRRKQSVCEDREGSNGSDSSSKQCITRS